MGLLSLLLPQRCAVCARPGDELCAICAAALVRIAPPVCARCGSVGAWPVSRCAECAGRRLGFTRARAAIVYDERARALVQAWKEHGRRGLAGVAATLVAEVLARPDVDVIAYPPVHAERARERGHASVARLAAALGALWELPVAVLLRRARQVERQRALDLAGRRANVRGAFAPLGAAPARVCLVDDVYTTGATASACAVELRRAGARSVEVVTLARALR